MLLKKAMNTKKKLNRQLKDLTFSGAKQSRARNEVEECTQPNYARKKSELVYSLQQFTYNIRD